MPVIGNAFTGAAFTGSVNGFGGSSRVPFIPAAGLDVSIASRDAFWNVIEGYGATYFCGHEHVFNMAQPKGSAWQVLVGAGGSPFDVKAGDASLNPATDRTYSWATVAVRKSGTVEITAYGFNENYGPTQVLQRVNLFH